MVVISAQDIYKDNCILFFKAIQTMGKICVGKRISFAQFLKDRRSVESIMLECERNMEDVVAEKKNKAFSEYECDEYNATMREKLEMLETLQEKYTLCED